MRMEVTQQLKPDLHQTLSPKMIQSMEILQLPMMALMERITQELDKNPVLEMRGPGDEGGDGPDGGDDAPKPAAEPVKPDRAEAKRDEPFERLEGISDEWSDYFNRSSYAGRRASGERDRKLDAMQNTAAREAGLADYLLEQLGFMDTDDKIRRLAEVIINHVEDTGYLKTPLEDVVARAEVPGATVADAEAALAIVQKLDPPGIAARDVQECLLLQIDRLEGDHRVARELIGRHLDDLVNNRYPAIVRKTGFTIAQIEEAVKFLRGLQPRPGALVGSAPVPYVTPDVVIEFDEEADAYTVRLAEDNYPNLYISGVYKRMLRNGMADAKAKEFIQNNIRSAQWLINSIEQRRNTLLRVTNKLVEHQRDYLAKGQAHLKPLPMTQVADELGIHVGTVSRAVSEKYAQTPRGILSLRSFFTGGTQNADGEDIAWDAVRAKLVDIIKAEDKTNPLSDGDIVKKLKEQGIEVARRTVAKYRKILRINSARRRRQYTEESAVAAAAR